MKRSYDEIECFNRYDEKWFNISTKTILNQRDLIILELKNDYLQIVKDLETFYPDECNELCLKYWELTQEKINNVINSTERSTSDLLTNEYRTKDHEKVHT